MEQPENFNPYQPHIEFIFHKEMHLYCTIPIREEDDTVNYVDIPHNGGMYLGAKYAEDVFGESIKELYK